MKQLIASFVTLAACGGEIRDTDAGGDGGDAGGQDGTDSDASYADVVLPDGFNPLNCNAGTLTFGGNCTPTFDQMCATWTRDRAYGADGHGICENIGSGAICTFGDDCPGSQQCQCSPTLICAPGQVCYSDTLDGATHCKQACTPSP